MKIAVPILLVILIIAGVIFSFKDKLIPLFFTPRESQTITQSVTKTNSPVADDIQTVANNLNIPWEIVFLPDGDMLVTERAGKVLKIGKETLVIKEIEGVKHIGEGGLLGMALHPQFSENQLLYLYSTTQDTGNLTNRVERYKLSGTTLIERKVILDGIKGSTNHDGGRIAFGPDGYLYITTGDAESAATAQDRNSLNGKILRVKDDGTAVTDNPFGNEVYSLGHRNPQGLAWEGNGTLWITEHGPSGPQTGFDEVNKIVKGANYGWPSVKGDQNMAGFTTPVIHSGAKDTWAPSGAIFWDGSLFFTGLRGEALYEVAIKESNPSLMTHFKKEYGRIRTVVLGPDKMIYIATNNTDGRGTKRENDDKIIKINPQIFR